MAYKQMADREGAIQQIYLDGSVSSQKAQEKLERTLIQIGSKNPDVSKSGLRAFGHPYKFEYGAFLFIAVLILVLCLLLSMLLTNGWKSKQVFADEVR